MGGSEIGAEELLPQIYHKNNLDCTGRSGKSYCSGTTKKVMGRTEYWNSF